PPRRSSSPCSPGRGWTAAADRPVRTSSPERGVASSWVSAGSSARAGAAPSGARVAASSAAPAAAPADRRRERGDFVVIIDFLVRAWPRSVIAEEGSGSEGPGGSAFRGSLLPVRLRRLARRGRGRRGGVGRGLRRRGRAGGASALLTGLREQAVETSSAMTATADDGVHQQGEADE